MKSAQVLLQKKDGTILGVSRRDDYSLFGLPGGKLEEGESHIDAAIREVKEETGLNFTEDDLEQFFSIGDSITYRVIKKDTDWWNSIDLLINDEGKVIEDNGGLVKFVKWDDLITGPFCQYNYRLGQHIGRYLNSYWSVTYTFNGKFQNKLIDIDPFVYILSLKYATKDISPFDFSIQLVNFQSIDQNDFDTFGSKINKEFISI